MFFNFHTVIFISFLLVTCNSSQAQSNTNNSSINKTWSYIDLSKKPGFSLDVARYQVAWDEYPVQIRVYTSDEKLIESIKSIVSDLDNGGYKNITILHYKLDEYFKSQGRVHIIDFLKQGQTTCTIDKRNGKWQYTDFSGIKIKSIISLEKTEKEYPSSIIKKEIIKNHKWTKP